MSLANVGINIQLPPDMTQPQVSYDTTAEGSSFLRQSIQDGLIPAFHRVVFFDDSVRFIWKFVESTDEERGRIADILRQWLPSASSKGNPSKSVNIRTAPIKAADFLQALEQFVPKEPVKEQLGFFQTIALPLVARGLKVIPVNGKVAFLPDHPAEATTDPDKIKNAWKQYGDCNVAVECIQEPGGILVVDRDSGDLDDLYEKETGKKNPAGYRVQSSQGKSHDYFLQTPRTLKLEKNIVEGFTNLMFSLRVKNYYVVGEGSKHPVHGGIYTAICNGPITPMPDDYLDWLLSKVTSSAVVRTRTGDKIIVDKSYVVERDGDGWKIKSDVRYPRGTHDNTLISIAGALRQKGLDYEEMVPVLYQACQDFLENYGTDWRDMCEAKARSACKYPAGRGANEIPLMSGAPIGSKPVASVTPVVVVPDIPVEESEDETEPEYDMTPEEIAEQKQKEYSVYRLKEGPGPHFDETILYGPAGEVAKKIAETNESHVAAVYLNLLVSLGNAFGRGPHFNLNFTTHRMNEDLACVGSSSVSRKGQGGDAVDDFLAAFTGDWRSRRNKKGFGSPQGIIHQIRDDSVFQSAVKQKGVVTGFKDVTKPGVKDKRLCIRESELSHVFKLAANKEQRTDELICDMWDSKELSNLVAGKSQIGESNSLVCKEPMVSIIGYTTPYRASATLPTGAEATGFGNRFLWAYMKRLKLCPWGGPRLNWSEETIAWKGENVPYVAYFYEMFAEAQKDRNIPLAAETRDHWENFYLRFERKEKNSFVAQMTSRGPAHVRRLATILCLIDRETSVRLVHLKAALDIWDYCERSVRYIFNGVTDEQKKIVLAAYHAPGQVLSKLDIHNLFNRHKTSDWRDAQTNDLVRQGYLTREGVNFRFGKMPKER